MIHILLCKNEANSILKSISYQIDWKSIWALLLIPSQILLIACNFEVLHENVAKDDCMFLSCHVLVSERIHTL